MHMAGTFRFLVSPSSGVPIYRQLMDQVRHQAAAGRLAPGEILPSVRQAADELQINPMTVSKAYSLLEREGVLENLRGRGMRVCPAPPPAAAGLRQRKEQIRPLLEQVATAAYQLGLAPEQVHAMLDPLLQELNPHEPSDQR